MYVHIAVDGGSHQKKITIIKCMKCRLKDKIDSENNNNSFIPTMSASNNMDPFYHPNSLAMMKPWKTLP